MAGFFLVYTIFGLIFKVAIFIIAVVLKIVVTTVVLIGSAIFWTIRFGLEKLRS